MTEASRRQQIQMALAEHEKKKDAERRMFQLRGGDETLPVINVPLSVPLLNAKSFRIAPALLDHDDADMVHSDPESPDAQRIVAELVLAAHSQAADLKESLRAGQDEPGVITRSGILINANTRCVLMRELLDEGLITRNSIRVAVLPENVGPADLYDLEAVLQKQKDHKDEYDLVSELMMLRTLHIEAKMTEQQIAARQRTSVREVRLGFKILDLMERARHLVDPPLPIATFGGAKTQRQNWKELVQRVEDAEKTGGKPAGDHALREYLPLHLLGEDAVHSLRAADADWINQWLLDELHKHDGIGKKIAAIAKDVKVDTTPASAPDSSLDGLDVLDFGHAAEPVNGAATKTLLDLTSAAKKAGMDEVDLGDGTKHTGTDVLAALKASTKKALENSKNRQAAGDALEAPSKLLEKALTNLDQANKALTDVIGKAEFAPHVEGTLSLLDDAAAQIEVAREALTRGAEQ